LVKKYSEFINYPIKLYLSKDVREQVPEEPEPTEDKKEDDDEEKKDGDTEVTDEEETDKADAPEPKMKTVTRT
jgi:HSP90 family molecular chaperone